MSEPNADPFGALIGQLAAQAQQVGAAFTEATRPVTWEYKLVAWDDVNPLAREGWELKAVDVAALRFVMGRQRGAADEAADMLAAAIDKATYKGPMYGLCSVCGHDYAKGPHPEGPHHGA